MDFELGHHFISITNGTQRSPEHEYYIPGSRTIRHLADQ